MKVGVVNYSQVVEDISRLDGKFHLSDGMQSLKSISQSPFPIDTIDNLSESVFMGGRSKRIYVKDKAHGVDFWGITGVLNGNSRHNKYLSKKYTNLDGSYVKEGWTLIARSGSGAIGTAAYSNANFENVAISEHLIRIIPDSSKIKEGFLFAYLASNFGKSIIKKGIYGTAIPEIEPDYIESIPVPIFPEELQRKIHDLINESAELRVEANFLLNDSRRKITESLPTFKYDSSTNYGSISYSSITDNYQTRIDSPTFINGGVDFFKALSKKGGLLKELRSFEVSVRRPGIFKRVKVDPSVGIPYIKGSELSLQNPFANCEFLSKTKTPFIDETRLLANQILLTCAGTVGNIKLITKEYEEVSAIGSQDIIRIESSDSLVTPHFLYAYLGLPFVNDFIQSLKYGSVIERVEPFHIEMVPVIVPSKELSQKITSKVQQYSEKLYSAFKCEQKAKLLVEKEIESWQ